MIGNPIIAIGLEVHVQVATRTKAFCGCTTDPKEPNSAICPTCLGLPGALPTPNVVMVSKALKLACAVGASVNHISRFARKHYHYPDLPKGYQITQFEDPLAVGGGIPIVTDDGDRTIPLRRIHIEEDAAKLIHDEPWLRKNRSYVDFNRCGIPLIEIVTEPALGTSQGAVQFLRTLQRLIRWLGISDAHLESGQLRFDVNVSVIRDKDDTPVLTEIKNLNSFTSLRRSIDFEIRKQIAKRENGDPITAETVLWDESIRETRVMRTKESSSDYRYIPDPDFPVLRIHDHQIRSVEESLPELPWDARGRIMQSYGISREHADRLTQTPDTVSFFENTIKSGADPHAVIRWMTGEMRHIQKRAGGRCLHDLITCEEFAALISAESIGRLAEASTKEILQRRCTGNESLSALMKEYEITVSHSPEQIRHTVRSVIGEHSAVVKAVRSGNKPGGMDFLMGRVMQTLSSSVDPGIARRELVTQLGLIEDKSISFREAYVSEDGS